MTSVLDFIIIFLLSFVLDISYNISLEDCSIKHLLWYWTQLRLSSSVKTALDFFLANSLFLLHPSLLYFYPFLLLGNELLPFFVEESWNQKTRLEPICAWTCFSCSISSHCWSCKKHQTSKISLWIWGFLARLLWWLHLTGLSVEGMQTNIAI